MREVDVSTIIDNARISTFQIVLFLVCGLTMLVDGFDAQAIGYVAPVLAKGLNLSREALGPIFSLGILGMATGNILLGLASDRFGRRPIMLFSLGLFAVLTLLKGTASSITELMLLQFFAGIGIGGAYPNALALASEYAPARSRSVIVTSCAMGYLIGTSLGGVVSATLLPLYGWRSVFFVGGALALTVMVTAIVVVPESIKKLVLISGSNRSVRYVLNRIAPDLDLPSAIRFISTEKPVSGSPVAALFREGRAIYTLLMWTTAFMILVQTYFVFSWLPTLFSDAGIGPSQAVLAATAFPIGSLLSSLALAPLLSRPWSPFLLSTVCALYAVAMGVMGYATGSIWVLATVVFLAGVGSGTQGVTHALNVSVYPTRVRSTGVGWCTGIGRVGSILGPYVGGLLVALHWSVPAILQAAAVPGIIAATAMLLLGTLPRTRKLLGDAFEIRCEEPNKPTHQLRRGQLYQLPTTPNY